MPSNKERLEIRTGRVLLMFVMVSFLVLITNRDSSTDAGFGEYSRFFLPSCKKTKRPPTEASLRGTDLSRDRLGTHAPVMPLASKSAQAQADPVCRRRFWRRRPKVSPLYRIARTDLFSTWASSRARTSQYPHGLLGSSGLFKIAHLGHTAQTPPQQNVPLTDSKGVTRA